MDKFEKERKMKLVVEVWRRMWKGGGVGHQKEKKIDGLPPHLHVF